MKTNKLLSFIGSLLIFLSPFFYFPYLFSLGLLFLYLGKYKTLNLQKRLYFVIGLILTAPLYYLIYLIIHRKLIFEENILIKILLFYILFILGNYFIYLTFKSTKNPLKNLGIKFLFFGALGGIFLVGIMVSWIGILILGISNLLEDTIEA